MIKTFSQDALKQELTSLFKLVEIKLINNKLVEFSLTDEFLADKISLQITDSDLIHDEIASLASDLADYIKADMDLFNSTLVDFAFNHSDNKPVIKELFYYIHACAYTVNCD